METKLSILTITYNHANFIKEALDSFLMQKTNFKFQIIVADDCSTDGTTEIIKEYAAKYPDIIKPIYHLKNVGIYRNLSDAASACNTEFVAMCDGDDFWTDEFKLQKQVDCLELHKDCNVCFHRVIEFFDDNSKPETIQPPLKYNKIRITKLKRILKSNYVPSLSIVYRWVFNENNKFSEVIPDNVTTYDWLMIIHHAITGNIIYLPETMGKYRRHSKGIWINSDTENNDFILKNGIGWVNFSKAILKLIPKNISKKIYVDNLQYYSVKTLKVALAEHRFDLIEKFSKTNPEEYRYAISMLPQIRNAKQNRKYFRKKAKIIASIIVIVLFLIALKFLM